MYVTFEVSTKYLEESVHLSVKVALAVLRFLIFIHFDNVPITIFERAWEKVRKILFHDSQEKNDEPLDLTRWHVLRIAAFMQILSDDDTQQDGLPPRYPFPNQIWPEDWLEYSKCPFDDEVDVILLNQTCNELTSLSIVYIDNTTRTLTMHPLTHVWTMNRLKISERDEVRISTDYILTLSM